MCTSKNHKVKNCLCEHRRRGRVGRRVPLVVRLRSGVWRARTCRGRCCRFHPTSQVGDDFGEGVGPGRNPSVVAPASWQQSRGVAGSRAYRWHLTGRIRCRAGRDAAIR